MITRAGKRCPLHSPGVSDWRPTMCARRGEVRAPAFTWRVWGRAEASPTKESAGAVGYVVAIERNKASVAILRLMLRLLFPQLSFPKAIRRPLLVQNRPAILRSRLSWSTFAIVLRAGSAPRPGVADHDFQNIQTTTRTRLCARVIKPSADRSSRLDLRSVPATQPLSDAIALFAISFRRPSLALGRCSRVMCAPAGSVARRPTPFLN